MAFDFVSSAAPMEHNAYISLDTGHLYWTSELASMDEEVPDDLQTSDRYLAIPHQNELDLGKGLALRFVAEHVPERYDEARACFRRKSAYARFKGLLDVENVLERWHSFEADARESAIRDWCKENGIRILEKADDEADSSLKSYYAARAREYERIYSKPERQADLRRLEQLLPAMFTGRRVLEIACGTGYWTQFIAQAAKDIVATDANVETLEVAAEKTWPAGCVRFEVVDAYSLPEELGRFDAAFAGFWWSHVLVRDRPRFLASLDRRLLPGAKVVFLDNLYIEGSSTPISHRDDEGNSYQRRGLDDGSEHVVLKNFPSRSELDESVAAFGHNTQFVALDYYWFFSFEKRSNG